METSYATRIILFAAIFGAKRVFSCDVDAIKSCGRAYASSLEGKNIYASEQALTEYCNNEFQSFKNCLSGKTNGCGIEVKKMFTGIFDAQDYTCAQGKEDALQYGACIGGSDNREDVTTCQNTMNNLIRQGGEKSVLCGHIYDFLDCALDKTSENCGAGSRPFYEKLAALESGPLLEEVGCGCSGLTATLSLLAAAVFLQWFVR